MAQIENLPIISIKDQEEKESLQLILDVRFRRRQVKEARERKKSTRSSSKKAQKSPEDLLKQMSNDDILKLMSILQGDSDADS